MIDILLLIILVGGIIVGAKRGLIVQLIHMIGFVVALIVAFKYYKPLAENPNNYDTMKWREMERKEHSYVKHCHRIR